MNELESPFRAKRSSLRIVKSVLFALFMREMQTRFGARRMGFVWVVFEPLAILVVILAFHYFLRTSPMPGIDYVMFMVSGIVPFHLMRSIAWRLTDAVQANQGLFSYRQVMPFDTFIARLIVEICAYSCAYIVICFGLGFWFGHDVSINDPLMWMVSLLEGVLVSFTLGLAFAMVSHIVPGAARLCKMSFIPLYITAGVFFPIQRLPERELYFISWNPYLEVIDNIRVAMFENYPATKSINNNYPIYFITILLFIVMAAYRLQRQILRGPKAQ